MNLPNRTLFHGDNLALMRGMDSECIDLIATDPPFNSGKDYIAKRGSKADGQKFEDIWSWTDAKEEWLESINELYPNLYTAIMSAKGHSGAMGGFCCWMSVRLLEMHRILKPEGSMYVHLDPTANSYIRNCLDAIFKQPNDKTAKGYLQNEIIWHYQPGTKPKTAFGRKHDTIFWYTKSKKKWYHEQQRQPVKDPLAYKKNDGDGRLYLWGCGGTKKYYLEDGRACDDVWSWFIEDGFDAIPSGSSERTDWGTQKPLALYERIIKASSKRGDWVFDPFAGCATTCVAAERLGRQWIGCDKDPKAAGITKERLEKHCEGFDFRGSMMGMVTCIDSLEDYPRSPGDDGRTACDPLVIELKAPKRKRLMTDSQIKEQLIKEKGGRLQCDGCHWVAHRPDYLQLDHDEPKSKGGSDEIENRNLLCGPCNNAKRDKLTLLELRDKNRRDGVMYHQCA